MTLLLMEIADRGLIVLNMYYMSARWYYHVGAVIDVDGQVGIAAMRDYTTPPDPHTLKATMASSVVWSYKGDGMKERKITIKVPQGDDLTVVDMFMCVFFNFD